jgi:hypothetical protein
VTDGAEERAAEAAVLSAVMLDPERLKEVGPLAAHHFGYESNRFVWSALLELKERGEPFDVVTLAAYLKARGKLDEIGGMPRLFELNDATPAIANVGAHARIVVEAGARRAAVQLGKVIAVEGANGIQNAEIWLDEKMRALDEVRARASSKERFPCIGVGDIFRPLEPIQWVVRSLGLCPGAPAMIAGYGYSGKTVAAQAMALAIAGGLPNVWGAFSCESGPVLHIDYEQGVRLTRERYQRLALAFGVSPPELDGKLRLSSMPRRFLSQRSAENDLERATEGVKFCIIDSLRAACPGVDENSSEAREPLDRLLRVSERTGCAFLVLHHSGKPKQDGSGAAKHAPRGSSGLFDACSSVLVFEAEKGEPVRCIHTKERGAGHTVRDFLLTIEDTDGGGLSVTAEDAPEPAKVVTEAELETRILEAIRAYPGATGNQLRAVVKGQDKAILRTLDRLTLEKVIRFEDGPRNARFWHVV